MGPDGKTVTRERDRRRHQLGARQARKAHPRRLEPGHLAGHRDGERTAARQVSEHLAVAPVEVAMRERGRRFTVVERVNLAVRLRGSA